MPEVASQTLDIVGRELNITLAEARTALENYVEQPDNITLLERCTAELHQVQGVLRVLEIYGAALLAEEMEQVASYLLATATERKSQAESLDALMRAMVQLPSYLERVLAGGRDLALILLPLLNDLRAVRGSSLLSEGTLLLLNLKSDKQAQPVAAAPGEPPLTVEQWARRLRSRYQVGLIGWIRGERIEQNLDILAAVAQKLEQIATRQPVFQLWWVIGAIIESLQEAGLESGVSVKRLLGLGDREIRRLYEQGEARYSQSPPIELLNNLLYYVGRAECSGPRVTAVRASFRLTELLPVDEGIEQERENLSAPSVKLMQTVAAAIREDLSKVKDVLDIFVRRGAGQPKELAPQVELLRKIGDTLGVLGLGELRASVQAETERLDKIVAGGLKADEATLVEIAATLIGVEDRLDDNLVGMILPKTAGLPEMGGEDIEFQQVQAAVLRECILNLARIKEAIAQNVGGTLDAAGLDSWQELMRGLKAGLLMLGKARAVEVIEAITTQLKRVMQPSVRALPPGFVDRLADAIVSVEYYMETLQAGRSDPWYMLDNAQSCVQALEQQQPAVPNVPPMEPSAFARTIQINVNAAALEGQSSDPSATAVGAAPQPPSTSRTQKVAVLAENADPELVKLFIEEAHEELAKIQRFFPVWDQNPLERDSLVTVRRSFHTLKGSGRMVGARDLGEFAWSIENLLNRILDNTLTRTPPILEVLRDAVTALPSLIEHLESGRAPKSDTAEISARAHALAAGKQPPVAAPRPAPVEPGEDERASEPALGGTSTVASFTYTTPVMGPPGAASTPRALQGAGASAPAVGVGAAGAGAAGASGSAAGAGLAAGGSAAGGTGSPAGAAAGAGRADRMDSLADAGGPSNAAAADGVTAAAGRVAKAPPAGGAGAVAVGAGSAAVGSGTGATAAGLTAAASSAGSAGAAPAAATGAAAPARQGDGSLTGAGTPANGRFGAASGGSSDADAGLPGGSRPGSGTDNANQVSAGATTGAAAAAKAASGGLDEVLREIYTRETAAHIAAVRAYLDQERNRPDPHGLPEEVYRACHTLSGSSKMAQARHGIRLAEPLDHWLRRVFNSGLGLQQQDLGLLADCMLAMESVATHLDEPTGFFVNHWKLQERIAEADRVLDRRIADASHAETHPPGSQEEDGETGEDAGDFDPEVAAIFTEEALELIDASEQALTDWRSEPASADYRSALKRPLHTLKGGARMAGIMAMGDLSHELETLVMQVDNGSVAADDTVFDVIQASLDELARMRELVANGRRVAPARAMIGRIQGFSRPKSAQAETAPAPAPSVGARGDTPFRPTLVAVSSGPATGEPPPMRSGPSSPPMLRSVDTAREEPDTVIARRSAEIIQLNPSSSPRSQDAPAPWANLDETLIHPPGSFRGFEQTGTAETFTSTGTGEIEVVESAASDETADGMAVLESGTVDESNGTGASDEAANSSVVGLDPGAFGDDESMELREPDSPDIAHASIEVQELGTSPGLHEPGAMADSEATQRSLNIIELESAQPSAGALEPHSDQAAAAGGRSWAGAGMMGGDEPQPAADSPDDVGLNSALGSIEVVESDSPADGGIEVVESGSSDGTLEVLESFGSAEPAESAHAGPDAPESMPSQPDPSDSHLLRELAESLGSPQGAESATAGELDPSAETIDIEALFGPEAAVGADAPADGYVVAEGYEVSEGEAPFEPTPTLEQPLPEPWAASAGSPSATLQRGAAHEGYSLSDDAPTLQPTSADSLEETQAVPEVQGLGSYRGAASQLAAQASRAGAQSATTPGASDFRSPADGLTAAAASHAAHGADTPDQSAAEVPQMVQEAGESAAASASGTQASDTDANGTDAHGTDASGTDANGTDANGTDAGGMMESSGAGGERGTGSAADQLRAATEAARALLDRAHALSSAAARAASEGARGSIPGAPSTPAGAPAVPSGAKSVSVNFNKGVESRASDEAIAPPQPVPPGREPVAPAERQEMARVDAELLDQLLNISGEASIARARLEQQLGSIDFNLGELSRTVTRLKEQLRSLEIETEAQILHRHEDEGGHHRSEFDPLELDRYSSIQQFSRALAETANDVASIQQLLENLAKDTQNLLQQQARTITELQNGLMRTRMVPFQRHVQRLARIVRQAAADTGKRAELIVEGASGELDRQVLERMLPPFEHMLRNAVVHGIEKPEERVRRGKPEMGRIVLELHREGAEVMVRLTDDGSGMNLKAIREKGLALGLIAPGQVLSDEDAMQLILEPGFSTAGTITQQAGRGVGMDVVATEIKRLGGALHMETKAGEGTVFTIRLPFTLAISHALVVRTGEEFYALPLPTVEGVLRLSKQEVLAHLGRDASAFDYGGQKYRFQHLATFVSLEPSPLPDQDVTIPVVLVRAGDHSTGPVADELVGSREIVVKSVGPQISSIRGISGATILGDGRIVIILDIGALVRAEWRGRVVQAPVVPKEKEDKRTFAMVVDDSITVRRVTQRLLERNGMRVLTARDGMDAVTLLQDNVPDIILLDIEMPRMDGYEVAAHVRNDPRLKDVPIIMITSRVGEKHRARAIELGVDDYLGKPYQEAQLLDAIAPLVERRRAALGSHLYAEMG